MGVIKIMRCIIAIGTYTVLILAMIFYGYSSYTKDNYNYHCKKGNLYKSATPDSYVFIETNSRCFDKRDEKFASSIKKDK